jgi:hypothetical protein
MAWQLATEQTAGEMRAWGVGGRVEAWGWMYQPDVLLCLCDPEHGGLADEVLAWFDEENTGRSPRVEVAEGSSTMIRALDRAGYRPLADEPFGLDQRRSAERLPVRLPPGYELHSAETVDDRLRVAAHRSAWRPADLPYAEGHAPPVDPDATSGFDEAKLHRAQGLWPYRPALDLVVTTADGEAAACCTAWLDETTGAAEIEPLGVALCHAAGGSPSPSATPPWTSLPARAGARW